MMISPLATCVRPASYHPNAFSRPVNFNLAEAATHPATDSSNLVGGSILGAVVGGIGGAVVGAKTGLHMANKANQDDNPTASILTSGFGAVIGGLIGAGGGATVGAVAGAALPF